MISDSTIQAIKKSVKIPEVVKVDGKEYLTRELFAPLPDPRCETVGLSTLTGIVDFVKSHTEEAGEDIAGAAVYVDGPRLVTIRGPISGRARQRETFAQAKLAPANFEFGKPHAVEQFIIGLRCLFVPTDDLATIMAVVGNITDQNITTVADDGVSQTVTGRVGIVRDGTISVPSTVTLQPYRTFREVAQPASLFQLRLQPGSPLPQCALHEADGGSWMLEAVQNIATYLRENLQGALPVIA